MEKQQQQVVEASKYGREQKDFTSDGCETDHHAASKLCSYGLKYPANAGAFANSENIDYHAVHVLDSLSRRRMLSHSVLTFRSPHPGLYTYLFPLLSLFKNILVVEFLNSSCLPTRRLFFVTFPSRIQASLERVSNRDVGATSARF